MAATGYAGGDPAKVSKAGDSMTGPLLLAANPTAALGAATKQYVDATEAAGPATLAALADVHVAGAATGQVLAFDAHTATWGPVTPASGGGGGSVVTTASAYVTTGNINLQNTGGAWQPVLEADHVTPLELSIPAAVGARAAIDYNAMRTGTNVVDIGVMVGSVIVRFMATGTSSPAVDGDLGWYTSGGSFALHGGRRSFVVTPGDLDGGRVRFAMVTVGNGSGTIEAAPTDTFYWEATVIT